MRICDRCKLPACDQVIFEQDDQRFDLCESCRQVILETISMNKTAFVPENRETPSSEARKKRGRRTP